MSDVAKQIKRLNDWQQAREAFDLLSAMPLAVKRAEVYTQVVELAVRWWCEETGPSQ